jgi:hypothetical protein
MASKNKAVLKIGYMTFVMEAKAAATLFPLLVEGGGEMYDTHWNPETRESEPRIKPMEVGAISLQMLAEETYALGKLLYAAEIANKGEAK